MAFDNLKGIPIERFPFCDFPEDINSLFFIFSETKRAKYIFSLLKKTQKYYKIIYLNFFESDIYDSTLCDYKIFVDRASALNDILLNERKIVVCTLPAFNYKIPPRAFFEETLLVKKSSKISLSSLKKSLLDFGYLNSGVVKNAGDFSVRGGIIDVFIPNYKYPVRIDFFGDEVDFIKQFDPDSQISTNELEAVLITKCSEIILNDKAKQYFYEKYNFNNPYIKEMVENGNYFPGIEWYSNCFHEKLSCIIDYIPKNTKFIFDFELEKYNKTFFEFAKEKFSKTKEAFPPDELFTDSVNFALKNFDVLKTNHFLDSPLFKNHDQIYNIRKKEDLLKWKKSFDRKILVSLKSNGAFNIFSEILNGEDINKIDFFTDAVEDKINVIISNLESGFLYKDSMVFTEKELFGSDLKLSSKKASRDIFKDYSALSINDFVIHEKHGLAIFEGLINLNISGISHDFLNLRYRNNDRLYVPVENISLITRYGESASENLLDALKSNNWTNRKNNVRKKLLIIANDLLKLAAKRKLNTCESFDIPENYEEFCKRFGYMETDDQISAIEDIERDLTNNIPMDRLICGDVGLGKTEVAMRAAFIVASSGKQVVLMAPTTILTSQHYKNFLKRFEGFGINICQLSRFISSSELKKNINDIALGNVKIVITTHAILSEKIKFQDLGLVIIDEEQHFGVKQKEYLKKRYEKAHFMTLSATPIPRTLQLAISGVKDLSMIATPPIDRLPVRTIVCEFEKNTIKEAIEREVRVGGQVFFVTPRVEFLDDLFNFVSKAVPELIVKKVHGKSEDIEKVLHDFCDCKINVLISTNIIDSGIDIPNANTILIHRFDLFGLSQLYQLRGRVGRSKRQAYAYFLLDNNRALTENAKKRLEVLNNINKLGSGFTLANRDLDIRGAGNLLGEEQSGYIKEVGVELYQSMLQESILMLKSGCDLDEFGKKEIQINLAVPALIPDYYISDSDLRLEIYKKIGNIKNESEIFNMEYELSDRFGVIPIELRNLLTLIKIKLICFDLNIEKIDVGPFGFTFSFFNNKCNNPEKLVNFLNSKNDIKIKPDGKIVILKKWKNEKNRTEDIANFFDLMKNNLI